MWLVLSTFLAILAGYSLPIRSDIESDKNGQVGSAFVYRMVINHRQSMEYVRLNKWPYYCEGVAAGETVEDCAINKRVGYEKGEVTADKRPVSNDDFNYDTNYVSRIFCYNADGSEAADCKNETGNEKKRYLVTFGDVDVRWITAKDLNASDKKVTPRDDLMYGFRQNFGIDSPAGYVVERVVDADAGITDAQVYNGWGTMVFSIPVTMWADIKLHNNCNKEFNGSCIIYLSVI